MKVFISSTAKDLSNERRNLDKALINFGKASGIEIVTQLFEDWVEAAKKGQDAMDVCFNRLKTCDYCIVMLGGLYGSSPEGYKLSATELEFNYAQNLPNCKIIILEKDSSMFSEKDIALISNQSDDDKKDYFRFKTKVRGQLVKKFYRNNELPILAISAIAGDINLKLSMKTDIADEYWRHLSYLNKRTNDIIKRVKAIETEYDPKILNLISELYEMTRAVELAQSLNNDNMVKVMSIRMARREGHLPDAKKVADELIYQLWPNYSNKNISSIPKLSDADLNVLCYAFLERGLISRYEWDYQESLDNHKVCLEMCESSHLGIFKMVKQRVFEVVSGTYLYVSDVSNAISLAERAEDMLFTLGLDFERGAKSRLSLLKAVISVARIDEDAIDRLNKAGKIYSEENNLLGIIICDLWKVIYYNSIGKSKNIDSIKVLDDLNKKGYRFMREKDVICKYIWNGADAGKSFTELFPKPETFT